MRSIYYELKNRTKKCAMNEMEYGWNKTSSSFHFWFARRSESRLTSCRRSESRLTSWRRPVSKISLPTILELLWNFDFKTFAGSDHRSFLNNSSRPEKLWPDTNQGHESLFLISKICFKNQKCVWRSKVHLSSFMRVLLQKGLEVNTTEHFPITHLFYAMPFLIFDSSATPSLSVNNKN